MVTQQVDRGESSLSESMIVQNRKVDEETSAKLVADIVMNTYSYILMNKYSYILMNGYSYILMMQTTHDTTSLLIHWRCTRTAYHLLTTPFSPCGLERPQIRH